jgi:hypothetical protein
MFTSLPHFSPYCHPSSLSLLLPSVLPAPTGADADPQPVGADRAPPPAGADVPAAGCHQEPEPQQEAGSSGCAGDAAHTLGYTRGPGTGMLRIVLLLLLLLLQASGKT